MHDQHQLERALRELYEDAPPLPGRVMSEALEKVAATDQWRWGWLPRRRQRGSPAGSALLVPLAAVLVMAVLAVGVVGLLLVQSQPSLLAPAASTASEPSSVPSASHAPSGDVIVVAADGEGDASTLETALALAGDGDTIVLRPGTYLGGVTVARDVHIRGDGPREDVVVVATGETPTVELDDTLAYAFLTQESDAIISGLTLRNAGARAFAPVVAVGGAPTLENLDAGGTIWLSQASDAIVRDSYLGGLTMTGELGDPVTEDNVMAPTRSTVEAALTARVPALACDPWREGDEPFTFGATGAIRCPGPTEGTSQLALFAFPDAASLQRFWQWRIDRLDLPAGTDASACAGGGQGVVTWSAGAMVCYISADDVAKIRWTAESDLVYGVIDGTDPDLAALHGRWQGLIEG